MAVFFMIGGWFFSEKYWDCIGNVGMFCWKKVKRIWWPFVLWCSLFIVFHNLLMKIHVFSDNTGHTASLSDNIIIHYFSAFVNRIIQKTDHFRAVICPTPQKIKKTCIDKKPRRGYNGL